MFCFFVGYQFSLLLKKARRKNDKPFLFPLQMIHGLPSHDFFNLEHCHHHVFAILFIVMILFRLQSYALSFE